MAEKRMNARFPGSCRICGKRFTAGADIYWGKEEGARHASCAVPVIPADAIHLHGGSGYGCSGWVQGQIVYRKSTAGVDEFLYVLTARAQFIKEDGMSFGAGEDDGYVYSAVCRLATEEESAPLREEIAANRARAEAVRSLIALFNDIQRDGIFPDEPSHPDGELFYLTQQEREVVIYGGGRWFVIEPTRIWAIQNNGADGDAWDHNNIGGKGGAGAMGWYVPYDALMAHEIRTHGIPR